ncbi:hypothetical protein C7T96_23120 [Nitratireductor sp. StC3]|nr:hypothetical protein C7T96_23120 [Nitratireductor sp. StC3]
MLIPNQTYQFVPRDGDITKPIIIAGLQGYSPGQSRKVDVWAFTVPDAYRSKLQDGTECRSYGEVIRTLAAVFYDGDEEAVGRLMKKAR